MREYLGMIFRIFGLGIWVDEGNNFLVREYGRDINLLKENNVFSFIFFGFEVKNIIVF